MWTPHCVSGERRAATSETTETDSDNLTLTLLVSASTPAEISLPPLFSLLSLRAFPSPGN